MGTVRDALQLPDMRRIELGYGLSITGELAGTVAFVDVSVCTLVTRLAGPRTQGKVLAALEFTVLAGIASGSILTPL